MKTRYSFGGDEHIFAEIDETMSLLVAPRKGDRPATIS